MLACRVWNLSRGNREPLKVFELLQRVASGSLAQPLRVGDRVDRSRKKRSPRELDRN